MFLTEAKRMSEISEVSTKNSRLMATIGQNEVPQNKRYCRENTFMNR